jgi:SAM-dependent methyltransferase
MTVRLRQGVLRLLGLGDPGHPYIVHARRLRRTILRSDERLRNDYLHKVAKPKLHIGGGWRRLDGWLNADIDLVPNVMRMDATQRFPFADGVFQYVYTEHMIEHVPYQKGICMLQECYRVMQDGGVVRVVTPDLAAILGLYKNELGTDQRQYLSWFCKTLVPREFPPNAVSAINAMFRQWGHQFIYDEGTLGDSMRAAGFTSIRRFALGESSHVDFQKIENEGRYPEGLLNFESVALEGIK